MKDYLTLTWFFFLALQDGNTGLTNPQITSYTGTEGGNITARCSFSFSGRKKLFCKGDCTSGNILIKTTNDIAQRSRYSIEYKEGFFPSTQTVMYVKLTQLKKSDSGWYMCGLARTMLPDSQVDFEIIVTEASTTSEPKTTLPHFTTLLSSSITTSSSSSTTTATTTQSLSSSSGKFTPSSSSTQTTKQPESGSSAGSGELIYVVLVLVFVVIILSAAGLIFCRRRPGKLKEGPVETAHDSFRETSREYEEIREERHSGCPPVEMSTVYTCAKFPKANGVETTKEYSSGVVTARCPQNKPELNSNDVTYTEVNFHKSPATSPHRTPDDGRDYVVYSVPLTNGSKDSSPPLYSTVAPH